MKKTKFNPVYPKPGKTSKSVRLSRNRPGVYIIKKAGTRKPLYIGHSTYNVYKTLTRHFQKWNPQDRVRTIYPQKSEYLVRIVFTTKRQAPELERALILKHKPIDNPDKLDRYEFTTKDGKMVEDFSGAQVIQDSPF